jgi:hypothetical protein
LGNPGGVDFFDDAAWKNIVQHWQIAARVARRGGVRGILFDAERYTEPFEQTSQFWYRAQKNKDKHSFAQYQQKARQRGREVMQAMAREYPDITILNYFLTSYTLEAVRSPEPQVVLEDQVYGLLISFLDGWLDVAPPGVKIVDGNENSYYYNSAEQFFRDALEIKVAGQYVVAPENRFKYRAQVQAGHALYLDRFAAKPVNGSSSTSATRPKRPRFRNTQRRRWLHPMNTCGFTASGAAFGPKPKS